MEKQVRVGVGVIIVKPSGSILLGKRTGAHGEGEWSLPGGHLEWRESFEDCCRREIKEETDIDIVDEICPISFTNDIFDKEDLHYVTLFFWTKVLENVEAKIMESDKCLEWRWCRLGCELPDPLFAPLDHLLKVDGVRDIILS